MHNVVSPICSGYEPGWCNDFIVKLYVNFEKVDSIWQFCSAFLGKHVLLGLLGQLTAGTAGTIGIAGLSNG